MTNKLESRLFSYFYFYFPERKLEMVTGAAMLPLLFWSSKTGGICALISEGVLLGS